jgi:hypothetical protein
MEKVVEKFTLIKVLSYISYPREIVAGVPMLRVKSFEAQTDWIALATADVRDGVEQKMWNRSKVPTNCIVDNAQLC